MIDSRSVHSPTQLIFKHIDFGIILPLLQYALCYYKKSKQINVVWNLSPADAVAQWHQEFKKNS